MALGVGNGLCAGGRQLHAHAGQRLAALRIQHHAADGVALLAEGQGQAGATSNSEPRCGDYSEARRSVVGSLTSDQHVVTPEYTLTALFDHLTPYGSEWCGDQAATLTLV